MLTHEPRGWVTVAEDIVADGVTADLIYHAGDGRYKLLIYKPETDDYESREIAAADVAALGVDR
jgi:hypothetical protein